MDNWLLIIVGVIFLISIVAGYVRGLLKIGISLLATVLSIVLVMFLAPYVSDALIKWTPADEMIEEKCMEMFMPQISADTLKNADLSGLHLGNGIRISWRISTIWTGTSWGSTFRIF